MQESSLHAALKNLYTREGDRQEVVVDGFQIDVVCGDLLVEVQTGSFSHLKDKLTALLPNHPVRVVHPVAVEKWIVRLPAKGNTPISRRRSPKRGRAEELFWEMVSLAPLVQHPNFTFELVLTREEEIQREDGRGSWRRQGRSIADRRLLEVVEQRPLYEVEHFRAFLPTGLPEPFTSTQLGRSLALKPRLAGKMIYCLRSMGAIEQVGKKGKAFLYALPASDYNAKTRTDCP